MLHQNTRVVSAVVVSTQLAKSLSAVASGAFFVIAGLGAATEVSAILGGPAMREPGAFHLFGAHNNFTGWFQSTTFSLVALLWLCLAANIDGTRKTAFKVGSAAMLYMSIGELTNWDHGNWARLATTLAPAEYSHIAMSALGLAAATSMALWFRYKFANRCGPFLLALGVYSTGAFGFELLSHEIAIRNGTDGLYIICASIEELLEMAGCLLLFKATVQLATQPEGTVAQRRG
jgi:hypothetical protein